MLDQTPTLCCFSTNIFVNCDIFHRSLLKELINNRQSVLITDSTVQKLYGNLLAEILQIDVITIPEGEKGKTSQSKDMIELELFKRGFGKNTILIAMGGGSLTDVVGFVASTYLRGVDLISIPTTLLAMVDASIGGKNGINTSFGKNLLGTIYHPKAILIDWRTLNTLPLSQWKNGLVEMLKMGLIFDSNLWKDLENFLLQSTELPSIDSSLILKSIEHKIQIVSQDPLDKGIRRILNVGHTVGHALETVSNYEMPHGKAVALGCMTESYISKKLGYLSDRNFERIFSVFSKFESRLPKAYSREKFCKALLHDKKNDGKKVRFSLIESIGKSLSFEGEYCTVLEQEIIAQSIDWMEKIYG